MQTNSLQPNLSQYKPSSSSLVEGSLYKIIIRNGIWLLGILPWLFGVFDRGYAAFTAGMAAPIYIAQMVTAMFLFSGWLYLKPEGNTRSDRGTAFQHYSTPSSTPHPSDLSSVQARMQALQGHHIIGREYILPFPYICQIYHLLNLKHLETVHSFSLSNLKVLSVSDFQPTTSGGKLTFQTMLDSPFNILRLWRQGTVEVDLTLHSPFTVELQVPVHDGKTINVMFNVLPLGQGEHKLFVDIYSNLPWPKYVLRFLLEFATTLTLLEDMPYLHKLTARRQQSLLQAGSKRRSGHTKDTMQLYRHYIDLYSSLLLPDGDHVAPDAHDETGVLIEPV
jgi:hypothetical protein